MGRPESRRRHRLWTLLRQHSRFRRDQERVKFADVRDGSPAAKAGLRAGDIFIEFDSKPIQNLYDFTYALRSRSLGDEVLVKVLRGNETISASVLLTKRVE